MPLDPFYGRQTVAGKFKQKAIEAWPTVYRTLNGLLGLLAEALGGMIRAAVNSIMGKR